MEIEYLYAADGRKVRKSAPYLDGSLVGGIGAMAMDYLGGFHYQGTALKFFPTAEGYVQKTGTQYSYVYNYTDHLGNIRLSYAQDPENPDVLKIIEESHYYPFGLKHANYNSDLLAFKEKAPGPGIMLKAAPVNPVPQFNYDYKYNGKEFQDEVGLNWFDYGARNYDPAIGRWMNVDPLAEKSRRFSPYTYALNNPVFFIDPDGMEGIGYLGALGAEIHGLISVSDDWIKNKETGKHEWKNEVTSTNNTPAGYSYVGKEDNSIVTDLFSSSNATTSDYDAGLISTEDFDNPYSAQGAAFMNMTAKTTMSVNVSADVSTTYNSDGSVQSKEFNGVNINTAISGKVVAPYPGVDISLVGHNMTLQGNEMKIPQASPHGDIRPGGDVPTLTYSSYWNSTSIQSNFGKSFNLNFSFKGQYLNGNTPMSFVGAAGLLGIPNTTNLATSIKFFNKP